MPKVHLGAKGEPPIELTLSPDMVAVRTRSRKSLRRAAGPVPSPLAEEVADAALVAAYPEAGVEVFRMPVGKGRRPIGERKAALRQAPDVRFAGGVMMDPSTHEPVLYTENLFVKFVDTADPDQCRAVLRAAGLTIKQELTYATNAFFVEAQEGTGRKIFDLAERLFRRDDVEYCHPELIRPRARKAIHPQQWHLRRAVVGGTAVDAHANVEAAHALTRGEGITIAVIDDGVDIDHVEFSGSGKVVAPRDVTLRSDDPRPKDPYAPDYPDNHGTACAGVACASGIDGASGVAPAARLMPIRLASALGSQREADAFVWAADRGADVISCSWGPEDGDWWRPGDPKHKARYPLPASTRLAIDYAVSHGRSGRGCVVLFAAGNGNESTDNDGYISYDKVIAVAACNDRGRRSVYSDYGAAVWCAFPSNDFFDARLKSPAPLTPGIWTTDRRGAAGYNAGAAADGDAAGMYTNSFGGTSSACPGAAGVAALVLAANPALKWHEVKDVLRRACDRIDPVDGGYDAGGRSPKYGHGRLNARTAVELAQPQPRNEVTVTRRFDAPLPDLQTAEFGLEVAERAPVEAVSVGIEIRHTYIGDLQVTLRPSAATRVGAIVLHDRSGGSRNDLKKIYDAAGTPRLGDLAGRSCAGTWTLRVRDCEALDVGTLVSFSVRLRMGPGGPPPAKKAARRRRAAG